mgnify:FL=1
MYTLDSAIATVIVIAVIAYAAWATLRIQTLTEDVQVLRELLRLYRNESERHWEWWTDMTSEDVQAEIKRNMGGEGR